MGERLGLYFLLFNKKWFDFKVYFYKIVCQINVCYQMIFFFFLRKLRAQKKVLPGIVIQHYYGNLILFISTICLCHKKI